MISRPFAACTTILAFAAIVAGPVYAETIARTTETPETFSYPLRSGESVTDVARIFRVPVEELVALNGITDPTRMQLGQTLRVPNAFAREVAELRGAEQEVIAGKDQAVREAAARQQAVAALDAQLRQTQAERDAVARELAAAVSWQKTATVLFVLLLGALAWTLKSQLESTMMSRKQRALARENAALRIAKEKYRLAASQLELRYQGIYGKRREPASYAVAEGLERLRRAFGEGAGEIERLLLQIRSERELQLALFDSESRARAWLFHPIRELLERYRFKYHTP